MNALTLNTHPAIAAIPPDTWDALGDGNPFTTHRFLLALEESGSVGRGTGWQPLHVTLEAEGKVVGAAPLYAKSHSQGEYIFDHAWAEAYARAGGRYYPKLQCAVPFTPVTGPRLIAPDPAVQGALLRALAQVARQSGLSGAHVTFCTAAEAALAEGAGFLSRASEQFHWLNRGYGSYDDFLAELSSRKRKALRKERERANAFGGRILSLRGDDIRPEHWDAMWAFYQDTGSRKWGRPYLTRAFFDALHRTMRNDCLLILAEREGVEVRDYAIIYDLLDDIKGVLSGMLSPIQRETFLGNAEVLQIFEITKVGKVAGCRVTEGTVRKGARVRIVRQDVVVLELVGVPAEPGTDGHPASGEVVEGRDRLGERDRVGLDRQSHRDIDPPDWARVVVYPATVQGVQAVLDEAARADVAVKASGVGVFDDELLAGVLRHARPGALRAFMDVDAPATLAAVQADPSHPMHRALPHLDLVLTYGGGPPVVEAYTRLGARACVPIYNALDPATHHPAPADPRFAADLSFLANRLPDREARVEAFFLDAAGRAWRVPERSTRPFR